MYQVLIKSDIFLDVHFQDPEKFIEDGGWEFLNMEASDSESEKSEESDEGYEPSDVEVVSESEDDDSDEESVVESEEEEV
jgi:nucleosome binding factor SPN SPT16 subunit